MGVNGGGNVTSGGLREMMNQNPLVVIGIAAAIVLLAVVWSAMALFGGGGGSSGGGDFSRAYFTTDDGATYFEDDVNKLPPFDKDGKPAVRAHVFTCNGGRDKFIGYIERLQPEAKTKIDTLSKDPKSMENMMSRNAIMMTGLEAKKPRDPAAKWISPTKGPEFAMVTNVVCPDGKGTDLEAVIP